MERFTISMDDQLFKQFDEVAQSRGYYNRSEAIRDLIREYLEASRLQKDNKGYCMATLSYIYNHHERDLASQVTSAHHQHHDLTLSSMHVHLDHNNCLEVTILRGTVQDVKRFANQIIATNGVRHGKLHIVPIELSQETHAHSAVPHIHSSPLT
ncbi:nickel-responsive transcriptional regulator NikR [Nitrosomonas sp.]|uniref:nickel-responsive transcriptional regulator NikR n=1 Tax=Nitrosomonas sp. TaxID=42353 RepID=UPI001D5A65F7|nr:nickel-responsive transcriptional regulator NikR [Nitrosomonas sp.]MBX3617960.1 nickel-responsive transcriptional regulator NikR [Nitrosomonas sp.]